MVGVLLWTLVPLLLLHGWMWWKRRSLFWFQVVLDIGLVAVVGPALVLGADLNPVRCLERNRPFTATEWSSITDLQPTQSDLVLQFHPWWEASRRQLLAGRLPLIADLAGGGLPLLANGQTGLWAPVMVPVWFLGPERGTTVMALWKIEVAGLGAFLVLWRVWRLRWASAAVGAVAFAGGAYQVAWLLVPLSWAVAALPWLWWMVSISLRRNARWRSIVIFGSACGWLLGSGLHPETAAIVIGSALLAGLVLHPNRWARLAIATAIMVVVGAALSWPTIRYIGASSRLGVVRDQRPNLQPVPEGWRVLAARQLVVPAINGHPGRGDWRAPFPHAPAATGVGGIALALLAAGSVRRRHRRLLWAAVAGLGIAAVLYLRLPPLDWLLVRLPPLDRMTLPRFAALVPWGLAVAAALSLEGVLSGRLRRVGWRWVPAAVVALVAILGRPWQLAPPDFVLVVLTVVGACAVPLMLHRPRLLASLVAVELGCYAFGINPVADTADRLPRPELVRRLVALQGSEGGRVIGVDGVLPANLAGRYGLPDLRAYDPLRPLPFARMFQELGQSDPVLGGPVRLAPPRLLGAWSVRFLVAGPDRVFDGWERVWKGRDGSLWRNPMWLPEVRAVGRVTAGDWSSLVSGALDHSRIAVVAGDLPVVGATTAEIRPREVEGAQILLESECDGPCLVMVARPWAPGWRATVDGNHAPIVLANLAGLGVVAPAGRHEVEFSYNPWRRQGGVP